MWRNWNLNPLINQVSSDEGEENYESPEDEDPNNLVSPNRPHQSPSASPRALLRPDPPVVDEVLASVDQRLRALPPNRQQRAENRNAHRQAQEEAEQAAAAAAAAVIMPDNLPYDRSTGQDDADVYKKLGTLTNKFTTNDPKFWFSNFERSIKHYGVKSQLTKLEALINLLTPEVTEEVKSIISLDEEERGATPYYDLKVELLKLYGPRPEDSFAKATSRVLVGKPSALGKQIINDFCECPPQPLTCKCCAKMAFGIWSKNLPTYVKAHLSGMPFESGNYKQALEHADKVYLSHRQEAPVVAAIKAENAAALANSTDMENPAVAAIRGRGGRGGRGLRGGRGNGNRGNSNSNSANSNPQNSRGGGRGGRGGKKPLGPRHPQALEGSCYVHHQYGPEAWSCADRHNCPMRDIENPKPSHNRNIPIEK